MSPIRYAPLAVLLAAGIAFAAPVPAAPTDDQLKEKASKLNDLTTNEAMDEKIKDLLKDKPLSKRLVAVALKMQESADKKDKPFKFNAAIVLGKTAHSLKEYKTAKVFYTACEDMATKLDSDPKLVLALESLVDLAWEQKDYPLVIELCGKCLSKEGEAKEIQSLHLFAIERLIQAKSKKGDVEDALELAGRAPFKKWYIEQLKSSIHREAGKYDEAVETLEDALKSVEDDADIEESVKTRIMRNTRYLIASIHVDNKKIDKAADVYKGLMKDDPENPTYPNDLGFVWADNDKNIEESEKLVRKALELDLKVREKLLKEKKIDEEMAKKQTAAYLDSLGWVLFKQKKYEEAKKLLLEASQDEEEAQHIEIWDHLADCLMALGDEKGAIETWTKSLKFDDVSKRDIERRKKVSAKLDKAKKNQSK